MGENAAAGMPANIRRAAHAVNGSSERAIFLGQSFRFTRNKTDETDGTLAQGDERAVQARIGTTDFKAITEY